MSVANRYVEELRKGPGGVGPFDGERREIISSNRRFDDLEMGDSIRIMISDKQVASYELKDIDPAEKIAIYEYLGVFDK